MDALDVNEDVVARPDRSKSQNVHATGIPDEDLLPPSGLSIWITDLPENIPVLALPTTYGHFVACSKQHLPFINVEKCQ